MTSGHYHPTQSPFRTGVACRCPRCGQGRLFSGYLTLSETCAVCGLDLRKADSGDGPAVFIILVLGALAVGLLYVLQFVLGLPEWLTWLLLVIIVLGGAVGLLRPVKGIMVALQYKNRAGEFNEE